MKRTIAVALPILAFLALFGRVSPYVAIGAAVLVAASSFAWRPWREALAGVALVIACAGVVLFTGEARGFFLVPTLSPFGIALVCIGSVVTGRPLTGLILNRVAKGPADWRDQAAIRAIYVRSTMVIALVDLGMGTLQLAFYARSNTTVLAISHVASGPIFATIVATTIVLVRRKS